MVCEAKKYLDLFYERKDLPIEDRKKFFLKAKEHLYIALYCFDKLYSPPYLHFAEGFKGMSSAIINSVLGIKGRIIKAEKLII